MDYARIGQKLRLAREQAGFSQEGLGNRLGYAGVTISMWEMGKRRISLEDLYTAAKVLNRPLAFFFPDGSLDFNVDHQISAVLRRSVGDFLGAKQVPVYALEAPGEGAASPRVGVVRQLSVAAQPSVDFGLVIPDGHLATIGLGAGDIVLCRRCGPHPSPEDTLVVQVDGVRFRFQLVTAGEEVACPKSNDPEAVCGYLVFMVRNAESIIGALKSVYRPEALES